MIDAPADSDGTNWISYFGPSGGFTMTAGWDATTDFNATINDGAPTGSYDVTIDLVYTSNWTVITSVTETITVDAPVKNVDRGTGYSTIQAGIDDTSGGDTIEVAAGTYYENLLINKSIVLQAGSTPVIAVCAFPRSRC